MAVTYKAIKAINPSKPNEAPKWFARVVGNGYTTLETLAEYAVATSTVSKADILAVLEVVMEKINQDLSEGKIVKLGDYFTLQVGISSKAVETPEEVTSSLIKKAKVNFRAGATLKDTLKILTYEKTK